MKRETRNTVVIVAAVLAVFGAAYIGLIMYSGTSSPFYTVESGSMMHSDDSKIGIIDTGDMVVVRDPSKANIVTYVEGHGTGYRMFGDHGDVILYDRGGGTPIIHRAILWAEYDGSKWDISSLAGYGGDWSLDGTPGSSFVADDLREVNGELKFNDFGYNKRTVVIALDGLLPPSSGPAKGYITKGDNNTIVDRYLVTEDRVIAVAASEIPWLGCIKLLITGTDNGNIPTNSLIWLITVPILIVTSVIALGYLFRMVRKKG